MPKHWHDSIRIQQPADMKAVKDDIQTLDIKVEPADDRHYIVIKTKRWAFEVGELDDFIAYLKQLCQSADQAVDEALSSTEFPGCENFRLEAR
jgi:hypothetical protein